MKQLFFFLFLCQAALHTAVAQDSTPDVSNISAFQADWSLFIDLQGFDVQESQFSPDGMARYMMAVHDVSTMTVSVFIEKAPEDGNHIVCRERYWAKASKSPLEKSNLTMYEDSTIACVEYDIEQYNGQEIHAHHVNAYLSYNGFWVDVQISKIQYKESDKEQFDALVRSIKINNPKVWNFLEVFAFSSQAFYTKQFTMAIRGFEEILKTEKELFTSNKKLWYVIVDNLGMAYGISGELEKAKKVYEEGLGVDSEYPMFYYNLACTYAELDRLDDALANLDKAYTFKDNMLEGEELSNPKYDTSFQKYNGNEKFLAFLKKYGL